VLGGVERKCGDVIWVDGVANEASSGMGPKTDHEKEREVMGVPESLETLVTNLVMGGCVHEEHDEEHEMASDATRLRIMDLQSNFPADLYIMK
jgi:hypothetical protein